MATLTSRSSRTGKECHHTHPWALATLALTLCIHRGSTGVMVLPNPKAARVATDGRHRVAIASPGVAAICLWTVSLHTALDGVRLPALCSLPLPCLGAHPHGRLSVLLSRRVDGANCD